MKKQLLLLCTLFLSSISFAQSRQQANIIEADKLSEDQLQHLEDIAPKDGWVLVKFKGESYIQNYSNKDYILSLSIQCAKSIQTPGYLIEYSKNYGDKEMGGIDFLSSKNKEFGKVTFYLDGKSFEDPFSNVKSQNFSNFYQAIKTAKILKIEVFNQELVPETGKQQLKLNRSVDFKLANGTLLDLPVNCR